MKTSSSDPPKVPARKEGLTMVPAKRLTDAEIVSELTTLGEQWDAFRIGVDDDYGGGSPGEWMVERMGELETEQKRRSRAV
jgi:hypothetical protein